MKMRPSVVQLKHGRTYRHDLLSLRLVYASRAGNENEIYRRGKRKPESHHTLSLYGVLQVITAV
jgi:hypothetical protein